MGGNLNNQSFCADNWIFLPFALLPSFRFYGNQGFFIFFFWGRLANSPTANPGKQVLAEAFGFARDAPASRGGFGPRSGGRPLRATFSRCSPRLERCLLGIQAENGNEVIWTPLPECKLNLQKGSESHDPSRTHNFVVLRYFRKPLCFSSTSSVSRCGRKARSPRYLVSSRFFRWSRLFLISCSNTQHMLSLDAKECRNKLCLII